MILTHIHQNPRASLKWHSPKLCFLADWDICIQVGRAKVTPLVK